MYALYTDVVMVSIINPRTGGGVDFNPPPRKVFRK